MERLLRLINGAQARLLHLLHTPVHLICQGTIGLSTADNKLALLPFSAEKPELPAVSPIEPCESRGQKGPIIFWRICRKRRSEGAEKDGQEKKRERQPRPLSQRPPRRTVEQHLAALPFGSGQALPLLSKDPCGSVWRFSEKQILDALQMRQQVVAAALLGPRKVEFGPRLGDFLKPALRRFLNGCSLFPRKARRKRLVERKFRASRPSVGKIFLAHSRLVSRMAQ